MSTAAAVATAPQEFVYRLDGLAAGVRPGAHRSRSGDGGFEFRGHIPLHAGGDARRLDLAASLRDPFGGWVVRQNSLRLSVPVVVVADLSASMAFEGRQRKLDVLADLVAAATHSAFRHGDRFGFIGCDERVRPDWLLPPTRQRAAGLQWAQRLRGLTPAGGSAAALAQAAAFLPRQRTLVLLASDFHLPLPEVDRALASLAAHQVVPVVLWQPEEFAPTATQGLARVREPEAGRPQWLWWRPALRSRWRAARAERETQLRQLFRRHGRRSLFLDGPFEAVRLTRLFAA